MATVSSLHHLKFAHPKEFPKGGREDTQSYSVFHGAFTAQSARNSSSSLFHVINPISASSKHESKWLNCYGTQNKYVSANVWRLDQPVPHAATCTLSANGLEAHFAVAHQTNVLLYTMNCVSGHVTHIELKENYSVPRILSNLTEAFRYFSMPHIFWDSHYTDAKITITIHFSGVKIQTVNMSPRWYLVLLKTPFICTACIAMIIFECGQPKPVSASHLSIVCRTTPKLERADVSIWNTNSCIGNQKWNIY